MNEVDFDRNGRLNYSEFLAATLEREFILKQENMVAAFKKFDTVREM